MSLRTLIKKNLISCQPDESVENVAALMERENVGAVLVIENEKPVGIVTDRDIVLRCISQKKDCESISAREVMTSPVDTISHECGLFDVTVCMRDKNIRRLPVVDASGKAVALISMGDVFQLIAQELGNLSFPATPEEPKIVAQAA